MLHLYLTVEVAVLVAALIVAIVVSVRTGAWHRTPDS